MSWLDEADTDNPLRLYRKYADRGVLDKEQVRSVAKPSRDDGRLSATALLFSQTEIFPQPIPIERARELCDDMNTEGHFVTTRRIDENSVRAFYEEGMKKHDQQHRRDR